MRKVAAMTEEFGKYDFGLDAGQEERAARLHREAIIVDTLHQGPCGRRVFTDAMVEVLAREYAEHRDPQRAVLDTWNMPVRLALKGEFPALEQVWRASGLTVTSKQIVAMGCTSDFAYSQSAFSWFSFLQQQFDTFPWLRKILAADDFAKVKREGLLGSFMNSQDTVDLGWDLSRIDTYHRLGMRMLQLTYNSVNHVGGGCTDRTDCGVTSFGKSFIERMNGVGVMVDISHCGRATTVDACKLSSKPVVASHAGCHALYAAARNKTDDEIKYIADTGGYIGIYCLPNFLTHAEQPTVEHILDHIDHVSGLVGWQHVGIGTDWPYSAPDEWGNARLADWMLAMGFSAKDGFANPKVVIGFDDHRDFPNITRGLVSRGYTDEQILGILGGNFIRVFRETCG